MWPVLSDTTTAWFSASAGPAHCRSLPLLTGLWEALARWPQAELGSGLQLPI